MAILYAPIINNIVKAFSDETNIKVKLNHNPAIRKDKVQGMKLSIKDTKGNIIGYIDNTSITGEETEIIFDIDGIRSSSGKMVSLNSGDFYKFQIAYIDKTTLKPGPYSEIAIGRYSGDKIGELKIYDATKTNEDDAFDEDDINIGKGNYRGEFDGNLDDEIVDVYKFELKDCVNGLIILQTEWLLKYYNQEMYFSVEGELNTAHTYELTLSILTINGGGKTTTVKLVLRGELPTTFTGSIKAMCGAEEKENGCVKIIITHNNEKADSYQLLRYNYYTGIWETIQIFDNLPGGGAQYIWNDYSVEQGIVYKYAIRNYINIQNEYNLYGAFSERVESNDVKVEFEHMYLGDGERLLAIKFNPKVSSFKNTLLEQKTDTIGGQYPFFFRNGNVKYKEIPISGLISYHMDDMKTFMTNEELGISNTKARKETAAADENSTNLLYRNTNLTLDNFAAERKFKNAVLDWLTNGKPKVFRSLGEGNYIVRLMNTSLSPNDTLGRMLHTFSSTGYECMDFNYKTMKENNLIKLPLTKFNSTKQEVYSTIVIGSLLEDTDDNVLELKDGPYSNVSYSDALPNLTTYIELKKIGEDEYTKYYLSNGSISFPTSQEFKAIRIQLKESPYGTLNYSIKKVDETEENGNEFYNSIRDLEDFIEDYDDTDEINADLTSINKIYGLLFEPTYITDENGISIPHPDANAVITFNGDNETSITISMADGNTREYHNLSNIAGIELNNATATIYGCKTKGASL